MNLLANNTGIPTWTWIAIAAVVLAAIIIIICVIIWASKKSKANKSGNGEPAEKKAEKPVREEKPVEKPAEKPVKEEKSAEKKAEKPVKEEKPAEKPAEKPVKEEKPAEKKAEKPVKEEKSVGKTALVKEDKPAGKVYHISKRKDDNKWQIKAEGGSRAIKLFLTQKEAIEYAKTLADNQDARIMIHKEDGSFRKLTY